MEIRNYQVFSFAEANEALKEKILNEYRYINVDSNHWYADDCIYDDIADRYGLKIIMAEASFDLDRANYIAFDTFNHSRRAGWTVPIYINDTKKFCKKAGIKFNPNVNILIDHKHYAGSFIKNFVFSEELFDADIDKLQDCLDSFLNEILKQLKLVYDYNTDDEQIIDTLVLNEYMFNKDGKID